MENDCTTVHNYKGGVATIACLSVAKDIEHRSWLVSMIFKNTQMKYFIYSLFATLIFLKSFGQTAQDSQAVKKVILSFQEDFNDGAFKNADKYTTSDWVHINPFGGISRGRDEVLKGVRRVHQSFLKGVSISTQSMTLKFLGPEAAVVDAVYKISSYELPAGVKHENEGRTKTYVVVKQNGQWLLTHDQNTIVPRQ